MASNLSDFIGGGAKPKLITSYTSGTGTYLPTADMARCFVRLQASGAGGLTATAHGGGAGAYAEFWVRVPVAGLAYSVPAGGATNTNGSSATFGPYIVQGGRQGASPDNCGGFTGAIAGAVNATNAAIGTTQGVGIAGGAGATPSVSGNLAGFPVQLATGTVPTISFGATTANNGRGAGAGGNSVMGVGNLSNTAPSATAYGAGGGYNQAGSPGYIEIWDYGV